MKKMRLSEKALREKWKQALYNAKTQQEIATLLTEFGYDLPKLTEGTTLFDSTESLCKKSETEGDEATAAYAHYETAYAELQTGYLSDRKKAKTVFRKDPVTLDRLLVTGQVPDAYPKFMTVCEKIYDELTNDTALCSKLASVKITPNTVADMQKKITTVKELRAQWNAERGQSENATIAKDEALAKMDDWMDDFYGIAKIALENHPQYLEALGIVVKR